MRPKAVTALALTLTALAAGAWAQGLPRAFAGYSQPALGPEACRTVSSSETDCTFPAMTAGRYLIEAAGLSTDPGAGASQILEIDVAGGQCGVGRDTAPWKSGPRTFRLDCEAALLADAPVAVRVVYKDTQATKDPKGPTVSIKPLPWRGVLSTGAFAPSQ